jgi:hypothetical protein
LERGYRHCESTSLHIRQEVLVFVLSLFEVLLFQLFVRLALDNLALLRRFDQLSFVLQALERDLAPREESSELLDGLA